MNFFGPVKTGPKFAKNWLYSKLLTLIFLINKFYTESPFCILSAELVFNILEFVPTCIPKILLKITKYLDSIEHPLNIDAGMELFKKANFNTKRSYKLLFQLLRLDILRLR